MVMEEVDSASCACCGLKEECTLEYISQVKANYEGKWLCGLCAEAVGDEMKSGRKKGNNGTHEALKAHMSFCSKFNSNPAVQVADGMKQMLRRRSGYLSSSTAASVSPCSKK
ncbi:hypothetical protein HPP92_023199 [Vanilla planifolia]|uniref:DUF1677 family protein n=1 Tax=Vanilla planifolia TaxID=51239 RepID=A0A835PTI3_VANPL|nr:hypothetical protein HPP92_023199 [Vanilla planifolia]